MGKIRPSLDKNTTTDVVNGFMLIKFRGEMIAFMRSVPLPILSLFLGLFCGLVVWLVLDEVQPKAVQNIFLSELQAHLDHKSRESFISYEYFVSSHIVTAKLFAYQPKLTMHLLKSKPQRLNIPPLIKTDLPSWFPSYDSWESGVNPDYVLLLGATDQVTEVVQINEKPMPEALLLDQFSWYGQDEKVAYYLMNNGDLYLLVSLVINDNKHKKLGRLVVMSLIDQKFLESSQSLFFNNESIVALIEAKTGRFISSSDEELLGAYDYLEKSHVDFVTSSKVFTVYDGFDFDVKFVTLTPTGTIGNVTERLIVLERQQRIFTSMAFIFTFSMLFFFLSQHINATLLRLTRLSKSALGVNQSFSKEGNQLLVLEDWIGRFIQRLSQVVGELEASHALQINESESIKGALLESSPDSIVTVDGMGLIIECNHKCEKTFGFSRQELLGECLEKKLFLDNNESELLSYLQVNSENIPGHRLEVLARTKRGMNLPIELIVQSIKLYDETIFTVFIHDISLRRQREYDMLCLAKFPEESPSPVLRVSQKGVVMYANAASKPLLAYWGTQHGQTLPIYWINKISAVFFVGIDRQFELNCDGRIYAIICTPIVEFEYVNIYAHEITNERHAEKLAMEHQQELVHICRLSTMGEMSTGLAHELNQPLAAIGNFANGCVRRLESGKGSKEDLKGALLQISIQANRAGEIIRRLRSLIGRQSQDRSLVNLNDMLSEVCSFMDFQAKKYNVDIERHPYPIKLILSLDLVQIEQVLVNFIRNALDALEDIPLENRQLVVSCFQPSHAMVGISIEDTGKGISEEVLPFLFDAFFTTKQTGMGMGLAISKTIIEDHKGFIEVDSLNGGGTKFTIFLPTLEN